MTDIWTEVEKALLRLGDEITVIDLNIIKSINDAAQQEWTGNQLLALIDVLTQLIFDKDTYEITDILPPRLGIYLENSAACFGVVLAAIKLGWAYLPIDPRWPQERIHQTIQKYTPSAVIYGNSERISGGCGHPLINYEAKAIHEHTCNFLEITPALLEKARYRGIHTTIQPCKNDEEYAKVQESPPCPPLKVSIAHKTFSIKSSIAYVMPTSGSTGSPLAVLGTTTGILNRCKWMQSTYPWQNHDVAAFKTSLCFVDSVWEIFGPILGGIPILAIPYYVMINPHTFLNILIKYQATHVVAVPSYWTLLLRVIEEERPKQLALRQVVSSGEQLSIELLVKMQRLLPIGCLILNIYGTTEVSADATVLDCTALKNIEDLHAHSDSLMVHSRTASVVPVGTPLPGVIIALLKISNEEEESEKFELLPAIVGSQGEVIIAGWGVAHGYFPGVNNQKSKFFSLDIEGMKSCCMPMIPLEKFPCTLEDMLDSFGRMRVFRTGDLGTIDALGRLRILGRIDMQIKIHGVRIDIFEVEAVLQLHPAVRAAAVRAWPAGGGDDSSDDMSVVLASYIELNDGTIRQDVNLEEGQDVNLEEGVIGSMKQWCASRLLPAAVPSYFLFMHALPRSPAGKINRSELKPPPQLSKSTLLLRPKRKRENEKGADIVPELSERAVHAAFAHALGHSAFEPNDSLFECGGTSLTAVSIAIVLSIDVHTVFKYPSVRSLVASTKTKWISSYPMTQVPNSHEAGIEAYESKHHQDMLDLLPNDPFNVAEAGKLEEEEGGGQSMGITNKSTGTAAHDQNLIKIRWGAKLKDCVDTSPILLDNYCWTGSHGGLIACFEATTGAVQWQREIFPEQPDPGMLLAPYKNNKEESLCLIVAMNSGKILFLDASSGAEFGSISIDGGLRAVPAVDPWKDQSMGFLWAAGHGRKLEIVEFGFSSPSWYAHGVAKVDLPAAVSAGIEFTSSDVMEEKLAFVACLDGTLLAISAKTKNPNGNNSRWSSNEPVICRDADQPPTCSALSVNIEWQYACGAPIFTNPSIISSTFISDRSSVMSPPAHPFVVVLTATGEALAVAVRNGTPLWRCIIDPSGFFLRPLLIPQENILIIGSNGGNVSWVDVRDGSLKAPGLRPVSSSSRAPSAVTGMALVQKSSDGGFVRALLVTTAQGEVLLYDKLTPDAEVIASLKLPAPTFALGRGPSKQSVALGCRDDHLYLISIT